jgi:hypothetical protein
MIEVLYFNKAMPQKTLFLSEEEIPGVKKAIASRFQSMISFAKAAKCARSTSINFAAGKPVRETEFWRLAAAAGIRKVGKEGFKIPAAPLSYLGIRIQRTSPKGKTTSHTITAKVAAVLRNERYTEYWFDRFPSVGWPGMGAMPASVVLSVSIKGEMHLRAYQTHLPDYVEAIVSAVEVVDGFTFGG